MNPVYVFTSGWVVLLGLSLFWAFIVSTIISIIIMIHRHRVYGYKYFDVFKKHKDFEYNIPILLTSIKSININMRILVPKEYNSDLILISDGGIFLIKVFSYQSGVVKNNGKYFDVNLPGKQYQVLNPYVSIEADLDKIHNTFKDAPIYAYVVFGAQNLLDFTYSGKAKTIRYKDLNYQIKRDYNEKAGAIVPAELEKINSKLR